MASATKITNGMVLDIDGDLFSVVEFQHVKPGKGGGFVRTKLKNVRTGQVLNQTFRSKENITDVRLEKHPYQYLYKREGMYCFMSTESYEQVEVTEAIVGDTIRFLKEGMDVELLLHGTEPLQVELPIFLHATVEKTDPGERGDTATGGTKPATLETGALIQVPLFIQQGEKVKVDTRTGEYVERSK